MVSASKKRVEIGKISLGQRVVKDFKRYKYVYLMLVPVVVWYLLFCYRPLMGKFIAFNDFKPKKGVWGSPRVGLKHLQ